MCRIQFACIGLGIGKGEKLAFQTRERTEQGYPYEQLYMIDMLPCRLRSGQRGVRRRIFLDF